CSSVCAEASAGTVVDSAIERDIHQLLASQKFPGFAIAVSRAGKLVWSQGFGYANLELKTPVSPRTKFRIASISKPITATCAAKLYESGRLNLDAPVRDYVPSFPDKGEPITVRQLAYNRSGIEHYRDQDMINTVHYADMTAALAKFKDRPLLSRPGERYLYSSFGYNLIGAVIEGVSGKPFISYMRECVFEPLGLKDTVPDQYADIIEHRTAFYEIDRQGVVRNAPAVDNSDLWPAGGYLSTAEDLVHFADRVVLGDFLKPATREFMLTPSAQNRAEGGSYAFGWSSQVRDGVKVVGHTGSHYGAETRLDVYLDSKLSVALLANLSSEGDSDAAQRLKELSIRLFRYFDNQ
ncbi:serine hydrolase domain-containing protein, partial [Steroidobacter sp.]|uniref:serine hydrolase domain-containing protein n=1 Tax=Steroidobacter sp. TaxID=1978227 RepID=UPI001A48A4EA